jgi:hypothetical protein
VNTRTCTSKPGHTCSPQHFLMVQEYRAARENDEAHRDNAVGTFGYDSQEWREYQGPMINFKSYLIQMRNQ